MAESEPSAASSRESTESANSEPQSSYVWVEEESSAGSFDADYDASPYALKRSLGDCLDNIQTSGTFATSGLLPDATLPGLKVHNVGSVGVPLAKSQANAIRDVCHQAPFGKGSETIVDASVRRTWQLAPDDFELRNPKWPPLIQKVTEQVARELGFTDGATVSAQLYKLLLYEEGAMFKRHKDTEKAQGMFGTLVICLPSEYEGGAVVASHRGESKVFENASAFDLTYIAWFADVTHEVKRVTSGHRLVLIYNLIDLSQEPRRSATMLAREKRMLKGIISCWARSVETPGTNSPSFLVYKLDHEYTDASLRFQSLKGLDKVKADYLREVCAGTNACFYLASMKHEVMGSCEEGYSGYSRWERHQAPGMHTIEEICSQSTELRRMIDLDGSILAREIPIDEADIVQEGPFERDPDTEDFEGYTGNEGASATQFYQDTVAVLVPFCSRARFLSNPLQQGIVDTNSWYKRLLEKVQENPRDKSSRQDLYYLAVLINQTPPRPQNPRTHWSIRDPHWLRKDYFPAPQAQWPIEASIVLEDLALFNVALESIKSATLPIYNCIGRAIFLFDLPPTHFQINHFISRLSSFGLQYRAFESIRMAFEVLSNEKSQRDDAKLQQIEAWAEETYMHKLQSVDTVDREDGVHLGEIAAKHARQKSLREYLRLANPFIKFTAFSVAFAAHILLMDDTFEVFLEWVHAFLPTFSVECRSVAKRGRSDSDRTPDPVQCLMNANDTAALLVQLDGHGSELELLTLIRKLEAEAGRVDVVAFESFFLPLLKGLIVSLPWSLEREARYGSFFRTLLSMYVKRFVQRKPQAGNWTTTPRGCGCSDCRQLDAFLANASQASMRFPVSSNRRQHLHQVLEGTDIKHVTDRRGVETLVVTKTASSSLTKMQQWQERFAKAREQILKLDPKILKKVLRDDYRYLTELEDSNRRAEGMPSARGAARRQRIEVIDLT